MDGNGDGFPQVFRGIAALSVVVIPARLDCGNKAGAVNQKRRIMSLKTGIIIVQITDFIAQMCGPNLRILRGTDASTSAAVSGIENS